MWCLYSAQIIMSQLAIWFIGVINCSGKVTQGDNSTSNSIRFFSFSLNLSKFYSHFAQNIFRVLSIISMWLMRLIETSMRTSQSSDNLYSLSAQSGGRGACRNLEIYSQNKQTENSEVINRQIISCKWFASLMKVSLLSDKHANQKQRSGSCMHITMHSDTPK